MKIGDRVKVKITNAAEWNRYAMEILNGQIGTVHAIRPLKGNTHDSVLVEFVPSLPPYFAAGSRISGHWFDLEEVEIYNG